MPMTPLQLERENLEAHVELCSERYRQMEKRLDEIEELIEEINDEIHRNKSTFVTTIVTTFGTGLTTIIGLITTIMMK